MIVATAAPSSISAEAAVRLLTSNSPPPIIDARPKGLFALEHIHGAVLPPPSSEISARLAHAPVILVYDSGTMNLDGAVTRGTEQVNHLYSILLSHCYSLSTSPNSILDSSSSSIRKIFLISGGLPAIRFIAPSLIEQNMNDILDKLKSMKKSKSKSSNIPMNTKWNKNNVSNTYLPKQIIQYEWIQSALQSTKLQTDPPAKVLPTLYVGSATHALDATWLKNHHITHLLSVGDEFLNIVTCPPTAITWCRLSVRDIPDEDLRHHFNSVISFLDNAREQRGISIVHCVAGASRSVAFVIAYLVFHGWTVNDALQHIKSLRPAANPNQGFLNQLNDWENECTKRRLNNISSPISSINNGIGLASPCCCHIPISACCQNQISCWKCSSNSNSSPTTTTKSSSNSVSLTTTANTVNTNSSLLMSTATTATSSPSISDFNNSLMQMMTSSSCVEENCLNGLKLSTNKITSPRKLYDADFGTNGVDDDDNTDHHNIHQPGIEFR